MPKLIQDVKITRRALIVDGEEFPYFIGCDGITVQQQGEAPTIVTVDLIVVGRVEVEGLDGPLGAPEGA